MLPFLSEQSSGIKE